MIRLTSRGQTLIEIIIAVAVAVLVITALAQVATVGSRNATYSQTRTKASEYAQEALEWVRAERDRNWTTFSSHTGNFCLNSLSWNPITPCNFTLDNNTFRRQLSITSTSANQKEATVTVSWTDSKGTHSVTNQTTLTNWRTP